MAALASPSSGYVESERLDTSASTHQYLMELIPEILSRDGHLALAAALRQEWVTSLKEGSMAADGNILMSREHYMSPQTHAGLLGFVSAGEKAEAEMALAEQSWNQGNRQAAMVHLGWAMHMVQDLTVPHHARLTFLDSHAMYESWVLAHQGEIDVDGSGIYSFGPGDPGHLGVPSRSWDWVDYASHASWDLFPLADGPDGGDNDYRAVAEQMLPLAARLSAGFFYRMVERFDAAPPVADAGHDQVVPVGSVVRLDASRSRDDTVLAGYEWRFPDGTRSYGSTHDYLVDAPGEQRIDLVVVDAFGKRSQDSVVLTGVLSDLPPPRLAVPPSVETTAGRTVTITALLSDGSAPASVEWRYGDQVRTGHLFSESFSRPGIVPVFVSAQLVDGGTADATVLIVVRDVTPPVARISGPEKIAVGTLATLDGTLSHDDAGIALYRWWLGDGRTATGSRVEHSYERAGSYVVTLEVSDGDGNRDRTSVWIAVTDDLSPQGVATGGGDIIFPVLLVAVGAALLMAAWRKLRRRTGRLQ